MTWWCCKADYGEHEKDCPNYEKEMWAVGNELEGPYEVEKIHEENGGIVQLKKGGSWFKRFVELFPTKEAADEHLKGKVVPWPKG